mgnify:FL=1|tara:strand:+ start:137 stop:361 length:225 start_codon:yes stop_codon:yes gene_type:complete
MIIHWEKSLTNGMGQTVTQTFVEHRGKYFVVSETPTETLIFPSDKTGKLSFLDVGSGDNTAECLNQIENGQIMS